MTATPPPTTPPAGRAPRPAGHRAWRIAGAAVAALLLVVALLAFAGWQALGSAGASAWLLARVPGLTVRGVQGPLRDAPLRAERVTLVTARGLRVDATALRWRALHAQWHPAPGVWLGLVVDGLQAERVVVQRPPRPAGAPSSPPATDLRLPVALTLPDAQVQALQLDALAPLHALRIGLQLDADGGRVHRIDHLAFDWDRVHLDGHGHLGTGGSLPLQLQARLQPIAPAGTAPAMRWQAVLQASGPLDRVALDGHLVAAVQAAAPEGAALDLHALLAPRADWPLQALQAQLRGVDLAALSSAAPHTRLDGHASLASTGLAAPAQLSLQLTNRSPGRWDEGRLPLRALTLALRGTPERLDTLALDAFDAQLGNADSVAGRWHGRGAWHDGRLSLQTEVDGLQPAALDDRLAPMQLTGPLSLQIGTAAEPAVAAAGAAAPASATAASRAPQPDAHAIGAAQQASRASTSAPVHAPAAATSGWHASADARLAGTLLPQRPAPSARPHADTTATPRLPAGEPVRIALQADARSDAAGLQLQLHTLQVDVGNAEARGKLEAARAAGERWHVVSRGTLARFDPSQWWRGPPGSAWRSGEHRLDGRWDADLRFAAAAGAAHAIAALQGRLALQLDAPSRLAGVPLLGRLQLQANGGAPAALAAQLVAGGNRVAFDGAVDLDGHPDADHWTLDVQADALAALAPLVRLWPAAAAWAPRAGRAQARLQAQGRWPHLRGVGQAQVQGLQAGTLVLPQASARWQLGDGVDGPLRLQFDAQALQLGAQRLTGLQATLDGTAARHRWQVDAAMPTRPPHWIAALLGPAAERGLALHADGDGRWQPGRDGSVWHAAVAQLRVGTPAPATPAAERAAAPGSANTGAAPLAGQAASADTRRTDAAASSASGPSATGARDLAPGPSALPVGHALLAADPLQLELQLDADGHPQQLQLAPGALQLLGSRWRWQQARWQAGRDGQPASADLRAELLPLPLAPLLARVQPDFGWRGDLQLAGHANLHTGANVQADVVIERAGGDLSVTDEGGTQPLGLSVLRLGLVADAGTWHFTEAAAGTTIGVLAGAQSLRVAPAALWPAPQTPLQGVLELRVDNLGVWGPWTPAGWRLAGLLHVSATLGGRFDAPEYTGQLEGHDIGARNLLDGVNVTHGEVLVSLDGPTARIRRFTLQGGDGTLTLQGGADFGVHPSAQLQLDAAHFQWLGRVDRRLVASGQARLGLSRDRVQLAGQLHVDDGLIDFSRSNAPTLDEDVSVVRPPRPGEAAAPPSPPPKIDAQVTLDLGDHLRVRGHGLDTLLHGRLTMTTPGGRLVVHGVVTASDGTYAAYGQKLEITRGVVDFNGPLDDPRLDILALRPNLDVQVGVAITGTSQKPHVRLYSEPDMADNDKLSWLVLGRAPEGLGRSDAAILQHAAMALLSGEGGGSDKVLRALGLDDLSVQQASDNDVRSTVVTVGKQISRRWYVSYEHSMESTTGTWQLIYRIAQRFTLRAQSGTDNAVDVIWNWRWH
jgi:translocation and assembly module TamB